MLDESICIFVAYRYHDVSRMHHQESMYQTDDAYR